MGSKRGTRAFGYQGGVCLTGAALACDAPGAAADLVFLSSARALASLGRRGLGLRRGRQGLLVTEETLALLGRAADKLRRHALPAPFGRPFTLGTLRLELFPSGHLPGSASLLVERAGRRILYAGAVCPGAPAFGAIAAEARRADAVCVDATFGHPRFEFPPRAQALSALCGRVEDALGARRAPVVFVAPFAGAMEAAAALAAAGFGLRAHRALVTAAAAYRAAGSAPPLLARFARALGPREVLLWPPEAHGAPILGTLRDPAFLLVSADREASGGPPAAHIPLTTQAGYSELLAYLEATGAREVALARGFGEPLAAELRRRGFDAYALGPPRQMELLATGSFEGTFPG